MMTQLNASQKAALRLLSSRDNIFLTGPAGTGKTFLLKHYLRDFHPPILASTGAAAILVGGRTFHSFFGLGILEQGTVATLKRALENQRLVKRLKNTDTIVIDEISMLSGPVLKTAETIARKARGNSTPWGGIRVIAVGDFAQLPPVNPHVSSCEWAFLDTVWEETEFRQAFLTEVMRTTHVDFMNLLGYVRKGILNAAVIRFLNSKVSPIQQQEDPKMTRLLARKIDVERCNLTQLEGIPGKVHSFTTLYQGKEVDIEKFKKHAPIPDVLLLKVGALVMLRQNDPEGGWVNGSVGEIRKIQDTALTIDLNTGLRIQVGLAEFTLLNGEGTPVVTAKNFPVTLAWAITIHKAQGMTLQDASMDLRRLWEPGQAYVALSRMQSPERLRLEGWDPESIITDPQVHAFYSDANR